MQGPEAVLYAVLAWPAAPDAAQPRWTRLLPWAIGACAGAIAYPIGYALIARNLGPAELLEYDKRRLKGVILEEGSLTAHAPRFDPAEVMVQLARTGFDGFLLDDHVPKMDGDTDWNHRGRAHAIGYMQGLLAAIQGEA